MKRSLPLTEGQRGALGRLFVLIAANESKAVNRHMAPSVVVIPIQFIGLFGFADFVRAVAERQIGREPTSANGDGIRADRHAIRKFAKTLY